MKDMGGRGELKPLLLRCAVQHYEWGRNGSASEVGRLYSLISGSPIEEDKPYAELWMGTHDSGHSLVILQTGEQVPLKRWLEEHPEALGDKVVKRWGIDLPFLFKVLSVGKALSIQAHPDKDLARLLHEAQPKNYKDSNHKPEMALALAEFEALCGFVSAQGLPEILEGVPVDEFTSRYSPPFNEFEVDRCILPSSGTVTFPAVPGPSIFRVLYGKGVMTVNNESVSSLQQGDVLFVPASTQLEISSIIEANGDADKACSPLHLYRAGVNSKALE